MTRSRSFALLAAAALLLAGCSTPSEPAVKSAQPSATTGPMTEVTPTSASVTPTPPTAPVETVQPAAPIVELKPGKITGSEETSTMLDNLTVYVRAVDGQVVTNNRLSWNSPLALKAGPRCLTVVFIRGVFTAQANVQMTVLPEAMYQLKFATDAQLFGKNSYCEFWVEDKKTGAKASAPVRVDLMRVEKPN